MTSPPKNSFVEMFDLLMTASVDRSNVATHCAFCRKCFEVGMAVHGWEYFTCWDASIPIDSIGGDTEYMGFLVCDDCKKMGGEIHNRFDGKFLIKFPNESTLFRTDGMHRYDY